MSSVIKRVKKRVRVEPKPVSPPSPPSPVTDEPGEVVVTANDVKKILHGGKRKTSRIDVHSAQINYRTFIYQIMDRLPALLLRSIYDIYGDAKEYCAITEYAPKPEVVFRRLLSEVKQWDDEEIEDETRRMLDAAPWLPVVIKQILVTQVYIMLSIRNDEFIERPDISFAIPSNETIVYHLVTKAARCVKSRSALFAEADDADDSSDDKVLLIALEDLLRKNIERWVNSLIPLESIVHDHLDEKLSVPNAVAVEEPDDMVVEKPLSRRDIRALEAVKNVREEELNKEELYEDDDGHDDEYDEEEEEEEEASAADSSLSIDSKIDRLTSELAALKKNGDDDDILKRRRALKFRLKELMSNVSPRRYAIDADGF